MPPHFLLHLAEILPTQSTHIDLGFDAIFCSGFCVKLVLIPATKFAYVPTEWETPHIFNTTIGFDVDKSISGYMGKGVYVASSDYVPRHWANTRAYGPRADVVFALFVDIGAIAMK